VWFAVMLTDGPGLTRCIRIPGERFDIRDRSTTVAMHLLRRALLDCLPDQAIGKSKSMGKSKKVSG